MICDIFIRSYYKDMDWLVYCTRSIHKFGDGFRAVIIAVPEESRAHFERNAVHCDRVVFCPDHGDDYLGQQVTKLHADTYTDAPYICHVDSDCIFDRRLTPADLFKDGKPQIVMEAYSALARSNAWRVITENFLGSPVEYEYMRRQPVLYPAWVYGKLREFSQKIHRVSLEDYVLARPPRGFSEYNALGAFLHQYYGERFTWTDASTDPRAASSLCRWYWSWGRIDDALQFELDSLLC